MVGAAIPGFRGISAARWQACVLVTLRRGLVLSAAAQNFDEPIQVFLALEEGLDGYTLVLAVGAEIIDVVGQAGMAAGGNPGVAQVGAVRAGGAHGRDDGRAGPELGGELFDGTHDLLVQWRGRAEHRSSERRDRD